MGELYRLDFPNGKSYIGVTNRLARLRYQGHAQAAVRGSKQAVSCAWRKYGAPKLIVLAVVPKTLLLLIEERAITAFETQAPSGYNMTPGGYHNPMGIPEIAAKLRHPHSKEHVEKVAAANRGKHRALETRQLLAALATGRRHTPESRLKMRLANQGRVMPVSVRQKLSVALKGRVFSLQHKKRLAEANHGRCLTLEHRTALLAGARRPKTLEHRTRIAAALRGRKRPLDIVQKISAKLRGKNHPMKRPEVAARHAAKLKGREHNEETKRKIALAATGRKLSTESREKIWQTRRSNLLQATG